jgi:hypothetical protein
VQSGSSRKSQQARLPQGWYWRVQIGGEKTFIWAEVAPQDGVVALAGSDGLDGPDDFAAYAMTECRGWLYAATYNVSTGPEVTGSGFDPDNDQLIHIELSLALDPDGDHELSIIHGSPRVGPCDTQTYYIVLEMTTPPPTPLTSSSLTAKAARRWCGTGTTQFVPLRSPPWPAAEAIVPIAAQLFADDFESGDTSAWSSVVP